MDAAVTTVSVHHSFTLHRLGIMISKGASIDAAINQYSLQVVMHLTRPVNAQSVARQLVIIAAKKGT